MSSLRELVRRWLAKTWHEYGGGYYGLVAAGTFLVLEWISLVEDVARAGGIGEFLRRELFGFGIESLMNAFRAAFWPVIWLGRLSMNELLLVGALSYGAYRAVKPLLDRVLPPPSEESEGALPGPAEGAPTSPAEGDAGPGSPDSGAAAPLEAPEGDGEDRGSEEAGGRQPQNRPSR